MALEHEALTERIIGAAIEVHRRLGPGFLESVYEKALIIELKKRGMAVQDQMEVIITYDGKKSVVIDSIFLLRIRSSWISRRSRTWKTSTLRSFAPN